MSTLIVDKYEAWKAGANACFDQLKASVCALSTSAAIMMTSGCPCFGLRATPFVFLLTASKLVLAVSLRFGAHTHLIQKTKAPEQVNYIPFQRFNACNNTTVSENVNNVPLLGNELQSFEASQGLAKFSQFSFYGCVGHAFDSEAVYDNSVSLVKGFAQIALNRARRTRLGRFDLPLNVANQYVWRVSVLVFVSANESYFKTCISKCSGGFHFVRPDIDSSVDDDSSLPCGTLVLRLKVVGCLARFMPGHSWPPKRIDGCKCQGQQIKCAETRNLASSEPWHAIRNAEGLPSTLESSSQESYRRVYSIVMAASSRVSLTSCKKFSFCRTVEKILCQACALSGIPNNRKLPVNIYERRAA